MGVSSGLDSKMALLLGLVVSAMFVTTLEVREDLLNNDGQVDASTNKQLKLKKYNDIWNKAQTKSLSKEKLERLEKVLYKLDRMELDLKHADDPEHSDVVKRKSKVEDYLYDVLREYDLLENDVLDFDNVHFKDERISQLWQDAIDEGKYTKDELRSLYKEMRHMEKKIDDVRAFAQKTADIRRSVGHSMENDDDVAENMVDPTDAEAVRTAGKMNNKLKKEKKRIHEQLKRMEEGVRNKKKSEFSDERVRRIWHSAQNAKFTADELEAIKEDLTHFQKNIDKLDHWENLNSKLQGKGEPEDVRHVEDKISEYKKRVKKYHKTMLKKLKEKEEL